MYACGHAKKATKPLAKLKLFKTDTRILSFSPCRPRHPIPAKHFLEGQVRHESVLPPRSTRFPRFHDFILGPHLKGVMLGLGARGGSASVNLESSEAKGRLAIALVNGRWLVRFWCRCHDYWHFELGHPAYLLLTQHFLWLGEAVTIRHCQFGLHSHSNRNYNMSRNFPLHCGIDIHCTCIK